MFQWFQMTLTCGVLNVSMVSAVSISTIIPCTGTLFGPDGPFTANKSPPENHCLYLLKINL